MVREKKAAWEAQYFLKVVALFGEYHKCFIMGTKIINDVPILKPGDKVGAAEATLLNMLKIFPFSYHLSS